MVTSPALYLALEGARPLGRGMRFSLAQATELRIGRGKERRATMNGAVVTLEVADPRMSARHARFVRRGVAWYLEDLGSTNGTHLDGVAVTSRAFHKVGRLLLGTTGFVLDPDERALPGTPAILDGDDVSLLSLRPEIDRDLRAWIDAAGRGRGATVVTRPHMGEEALAREVHARAGRPGGLEIFACAGATAAEARDSAARARDGTLYLDGADQLDPEAQRALLATLPALTIFRTSSPLASRLDFDAELLAIASGVVHELVPLRERPMDLGLLLSAILPRVAGPRAPDVRLHHDLVQAMLAHAWTQGERELERMVAGALAATPEGTLRVEHVAAALQEMKLSEAPPPRPEPAPREADARIREELLLALADTQGNVSEVARRMKRTRMQIHRWMKRWDIDVDAYRR